MGTYSLDELYAVPHKHLLASAMLLIAIAVTSAFVWDRQPRSPIQALRLKGRFEAGLAAGFQTAAALGIVMALSMEMPSMPWVDSRSGSLWEAGQFVVAGASVALWATLTVGLPVALAVAALASWRPRALTPARGLVVGLVIALAVTSRTMRWLGWCGSVPVAQQALAVAMFSTVSLVAGAAAGCAASRDRSS